jgi:hypothetical protein
MPDDLRTQVSGKRAEFLIEEYKAITDSLLRNEESGEKRAAFFMTLAGAAGGVLAFLFNGKPDESLLPKAAIPAVTSGAAAILLFLGIMTVRRLAERHRVTDQYKYFLRQIRRTFISYEDSQTMPNSFFKEAYDDLRERKEDGPEWAKKWHLDFKKGGWLECVSAVNAVLFGVCTGALIAWSGLRWFVWLPLALLFSLEMWRDQRKWTDVFLNKEIERLRAADADDRARTATR